MVDRLVAAVLRLISAQINTASMNLVQARQEPVDLVDHKLPLCFLGDSQIDAVILVETWIRPPRNEVLDGRENVVDPRGVFGNANARPGDAGAGEMESAGTGAGGERTSALPFSPFCGSARAVEGSLSLR